MNILGKEQPIIYQIDDVFDPRMANMVYNAQQNYINALREDYLQTDKDLKDFRKEYGDFYSPFAKDNENWDRLTNGAIREVMDKYGPDMLRSIEGRAEIQKALNSIPYGELQKLRASVQPAMQFLKNKGILDSKGLYSKDFQNWLNKQAGITNFEDWDTLKDGVWTKESPDPFDSLNTATHSWYDQRQALYKGMKNGNRVYSYDFNDLKNTAKANAQGFINTPRGAYEFMNIKEQLKRTNPNMSEEDLQNKAFDILDDRIAQANIEMLLPEKYEADPYALARYKADLDDRNARRASARAAANQPHSGGQGGILQYSTRFGYNANQSFIDRTLNGANLSKSMLKIQRYWINKANKAKTHKEKNEALAHVKWWKGSEKWTPEQLVKNGIIKIDSNGVVTPTDRFTNAFMYSNSTDANYDKTKGGYSQQLMRNAKSTYSVFQNRIQPSNKAEHSMWSDIMAGDSELRSMPGTSNKYRMLRLNDPTLRYAPIRQANVTGSKMFRYNSLQRRFDRWLRSNSSGNGYLVNKDINVAYIPKKQRDGMMTDISGNISITGRQFKQFCNKFNITTDEGIRNAAVQLGLGIYEYQSNDKDKNKNRIYNTYYTIPMIRTMSNDGGFGWRDINTRMNQEEFGKGKAYAEEINSEAASLQQR